MTRRGTSTTDYREWNQRSVRISGAEYQLASKPGVAAHDAVDPGALLLAEYTTASAGDTVVHLNCQNGLLGSVVSRVAARVVLTDRNVVAVTAARRTLAANEATRAEVLLGHGASSIPPDVRADVVAIRLPTERLATLQLLTDAFRMLPVGGRCYLAGATNEGAKTAVGTMEALFGNGGVLAVQSGHRVAMATKRHESAPESIALASPYLDSAAFRELPGMLRGRSLTLYTRPGVFSWDHMDDATELLAEAMQVNAGESVLDLGCGSGALGTLAGLLSGSGRATMVDADVEAVRCAALTAQHAGMTNAVALTSDIAGEVLDQRFDVVVTNPPFHIGKATDLDVPAQFIRDAHAVLEPAGRLYLVANRTLPYERTIFQLFGNITTLHDGRRFKVLSARKGAAE